MRPCAHHAVRTRYSYVLIPTIVDNSSVLKYLPILRVLIHQPSSMGQGTPHPHPRSKGPDQTLKPVRNCDSVDQDLDMGSCPHGVFTSFLYLQKMVSTPALSPTLLFDETPWYCQLHRCIMGRHCAFAVRHSKYPPHWYICGGSCQLGTRRPCLAKVGGYVHFLAHGPRRPTAKILGTAGDIRIALTSGHSFCPNPSTLYNLSSGDSSLCRALDSRHRQPSCRYSKHPSPVPASHILHAPRRKPTGAVKCR
ncbi:hypothetical protein CMEL01_10376 [Colletotrichum melonis]|uniref:Uncharacterized protein n=1 Tax=Colletotrichum melonis TaxID=1209925 RepID=A0AAI9TUT7_9PEZI|nr:hypothetical protein CMEL01_10376 [Colletotrichum melonis]